MSGREASETGEYSIGTICDPTCNCALKPCLINFYFSTTSGYQGKFTSSHPAGLTHCVIFPNDKNDTSAKTTLSKLFLPVQDGISNIEFISLVIFRRSWIR